MTREPNSSLALIDCYLFVQLDVGKDGVNPPGLGEHRAEGQGEAGHEDPGLDRADVAEGRLRGEGGVQPQDDHRGVAQEAANDDQVVQVGRGHLDLPEMITQCTV